MEIAVLVADAKKAQGAVDVASMGSELDEGAVSGADVIELASEAEGNVQRVMVSDSVFALPYNEALVHQVVTACQASARAGTRAQKNRSRVRGGGAKPYRQKGTGRARAGTNRSPIWRGGGVTFAARPQRYDQKLSRKMFRGALRSIISELIRQDAFMVVDAFSVAVPKTRDVAVRLREMGLRDVLIVTDKEDENLKLSVRNLNWVGETVVSRLDPLLLISYEKVLITLAGMEKLQERMQ